MSLFYMRLIVSDFFQGLMYAALKPAWKQLAHYRITLLEAELYRVERAGPFSEEQFYRLKNAVGASEKHLLELNERVAYLELCRCKHQKPEGILNYCDISRFADMSRVQLMGAVASRREKPTGAALFLLS